MKIKFVKMGINGEGIGYIDHHPVFCDGVLPGEVAEVEIIEEKKNYSKAEMKKIIRYSPDRIRPASPFYIEEGCPLMVLNYDAQLKFKKLLLEEALYKYGNVRNRLVRDIRPSENIFCYRSQCKLPVQESNKHITTGMYVPGTNHYHPVDHSVIHSKELEDTRMAVLDKIDHSSLKAYDQKTMKGLRYLVIRTIGGKSQCTLVTGKDKISDALINAIMKVEGMQGVFQSINTDRRSVQIFGSRIRKLAGNEYLPAEMGGIKLELAPEAFFQLNVQQAEKMYQTAVGKIDPCDTMVEAYAGVGAISLMAKDKAKHIIGIESVQDAVASAKRNAQLNQITNAEFICDDAAEGLKKILAERDVDTLVCDPPRSGMDDEMLKVISESSIRKIIYISCNPATLARNLKELKHHYQVRTVIPFDLFPNTPHVESVTVLERA